jgi:hypothetical protein
VLENRKEFLKKCLQKLYQVTSIEKFLEYEGLCMGSLGIIKA